MALAIEDSERYGLSDLNAYADWRTTDLFPRSNGFVKLGPEGSLSSVKLLRALLTSVQAEHSVTCQPASPKRSDTLLSGIAMFHQMHCLQRIRSALVQGDPGHHTRHCLNLLRQTVLCASDTTLDPLNSAKGTDGLGIVHVCRDWQKVYDFVEENQLKHMNGSK